jgi:hypothetical protein
MNLSIKNISQNFIEPCKAHPEILDSRLKCILKYKKTNKCFFTFCTLYTSYLFDVQIIWLLLMNINDVIGIHVYSNMNPSMNA